MSGVKHTGYISAKDVETIDTKQQVMKGIGIKRATSVYSAASKDSNILKNYKSGQILQYRTFSKNWFEATVYVGGKAKKGYISTMDVEPIIEGQQPLTGVAIKQPTRIYSLASKESKALKDYKYGHILKIRPFSNNWYKATVNVNGKPRTGYIFKSDVNTDLNSPLTGYAKANATAIYSDASRAATVLKRYKKGHSLKYRPYNSNWFRATVYVNGKARTGYVYTGDVSPNPATLRAHALANPTYVYSKTSRNSTKLKSYKKGTLLQIRPYNEFWHKATVYVKGKAQTGYIHVKDVGDLPVKKKPGFDIPILMYHQIGENPVPEGYGLFVKSENFQKQMNYLKTAGFTPIHFDEIPNIKNIKNPIIITFDDGYENNMIAYEILKKVNDKSFKAKATFFIIGAKIDVKNYLSAAQIKEMSDSGIISIQSHTMTHPFFNDNETAGRINYTEQLRDNKLKLEQLTGKKVRVLAYPYGSYNDLVIAETKKYYDYAVTTKPGIANTNDSPYELKRVRVRFDTTLEQFKKSIGR
ncbi:polysaccharide deacetylase family protein [Siminovitchia sp. 179-K 8D1 HS]|uniref:polysaccharide deacetylase family protein n=1 Tax=Siminovitchia sp. 179-K 8D1 HS TaxID=3142385 RepID=UPI00399F5CC4